MLLHFHSYTLGNVAHATDIHFKGIVHPYLKFHPSSTHRCAGDEALVTFHDPQNRRGV